MSQDPEDLMQIDITDENGQTRKAWVCRIVAEKDLTNTGPNGENVTVAKKGEKGGYVEVACDEDGNPVRDKDGNIPAPVEPGTEGAPSETRDGKLTGLSQMGTSWVHAGTVIAGEVSVRDNAQFMGPDALSTGADEYTGDVGVGGSYFRSNGQSTFEGKGTYIDMDMKTGAKYEFSGGTQVGGPVVFEEGQGKFQDGPGGEETMMFAAEEGTMITVATKEGFETNGMTVLDSTMLAGSFKGNKDLIIQNSTVTLDGTTFDGPCTVVGQVVGSEADGLTISSDADLDAIAPMPMADAEPGLTGTERREKAEEFKAYTDSQEYRDHVDTVVAHELGENFGDSSVQNHEGDIHDRMHTDLTDAWDGLTEDLTADEFYETHRISSEYQAGINDAPTEDQAELMQETGMTMEQIREATKLTAADGTERGDALGEGWMAFHDVRAEHQNPAAYGYTNSHTQRVLIEDGRGLNPNASKGLLMSGMGDKETMPISGTTTAQQRGQHRNPGSLAAIAEAVTKKEEEQKNNGPEKG